jgi:MFS family permease
LLQLILVSLIAHCALAGARVTSSLYALSLHATEFTVGMLISLFAVFPMLFAVPAGRLVDRIGPRRPILAGCLAVLAGCALPGWISGLPVLHLTALLVGSGFMIVQVASQHTVGAISTVGNRTSNFSWLALGFSISGFCGPVLAGFVIDHARHGLSYMVFAGLAGGALVLAAVGSLKRIRLAAHDNAGNKVIDATPPGAIGLLRDREMMRIYFVGTLLSSAWDLFTFVVPLHGARLGFSASTIGIVLGCFAAATFVVRLAMPWMARRYNEWQILTGALVISVLCYAVFPFTARPLTVMLVAAALGLAVGASQPNMLALLHLTAPPERAAEAVGIRVTIGNASQFLLPLAFGGAGAALGLSAVFWAMGALMGAGVPFAWRRAAQR